MEVEEADLKRFVSICKKKGLSFVVYRFPGDNQLRAIVSSFPAREVDQEKIEDLKGFVFAPFNQSEKMPMLVLQPQVYLQQAQNWVEQVIDMEIGQCSIAQLDETAIDQVTEQVYIQQVQLAIDEINTTNLEKVILSRVIKFENDSRKDSATFYQELEAKYSNAFVYYAHFVGYSSWIGASPESLLYASDKKIKTVALAGTQKNEEVITKVNWGEKEKNEQHVVEEYIENVFQSNNVVNYSKNGPYTSVAGNMYHLKTNYEFSLDKNKVSVDEILKDIHPTPAVCGLPKQKALDFISSNEAHSREYYCGYLGPVNMDEETALFVNLRCARIMEDHLKLFVGGGITKDSDPQKEWKETTLKAQTLLSVIEKI